MQAVRLPGAGSSTVVSKRWTRWLALHRLLAYTLIASAGGRYDSAASSTEASWRSTRWLARNPLSAFTLIQWPADP